MNLDRTKAVVDLRTGFDFSKPRRSAEAIARVLWDQDVQAWWSLQNGRPAFNPTHTVEILLPTDEHRKIVKAVEEFEADLRDDELAAHVGTYLESVSSANVDWATIFLLGPLWAYMIENSEKKQRREAALDRLFSEMSKYIVVSTR